MSLQIRKTVYRGRKGFLICGRAKVNPGVFGTQIFTETRVIAERIRDKVNRGERTTLEDFRPEEMPPRHLPEDSPLTAIECERIARRMLDDTAILYDILRAKGGMTR